jgi:hypothetical protein
MDKNAETIQRSGTEKESRIRKQQAQEIYLFEILISYLKNKVYFVKDFIA